MINTLHTYTPPIGVRIRLYLRGVCVCGGGVQDRNSTGLRGVQQFCYRC